MSKNNNAANQLEVVDADEDFDFSEMDIMESDYNNDEMMNGMMHNIIEASGHQMQLALELTTLAIDKDTAAMSVDDVLAVFKKAAVIIEEKYPLNAILNKFIASN